VQYHFVVLGKSDPLTENFIRIQYNSYGYSSRVVPSLVEIGEWEVTKMMHHALYTGAPGAVPPKILQTYSFPTPIRLPSFIHIDPFYKKIYMKVSFTSVISE